MKLIPQNEIEEATENYSRNRFDLHNFIKYGDFCSQGFKAGVEFAESKLQDFFKDIIIENQGLKLYKDNEAKRFEELAIEFAEWIAYEQNNKTKLWKYWDCGIGEYTTEELFEIFLKERNENDKNEKKSN